MNAGVTANEIRAGSCLAIKSPVQTDAAIQADIAAGLSSSPTAQTDRIEIDVRDGIVTLLGTVASLDALQRATSTASLVPGVRALINEVRLRAAAGAISDSRQLALAILRGLAQTTFSTQANITPVIRAGRVVLSGSVLSESQRREIVSRLRDIEGVEAIDDHLRVRLSLAGQPAHLRSPPALG